MKNILLYIIILFGVIIASCNSQTTGGGEAKLIVASDTASVIYQCPMKCQGDTTYTTAGLCPVCGMDLEKID